MGGMAAVGHQHSSDSGFIASAHAARASAFVGASCAILLGIAHAPRSTKQLH
jgi:hypothetical protein